MTSPSPFGGTSSTFSFAPAATFGANREDEEEGEGEGDETGEGADADETHAGEFKPLISLPEIQVKTMEEDEDVLFKMRAKLFVFVKEDVYGGELRQNWWRERGLGDIKILKHKINGGVRLLMRQEKTHKICLNHMIDPETVMSDMVGSSDKAVTFFASDFADGTVKTEKFAVRFAATESVTSFKPLFEQAKVTNKMLKQGATASGGDVADKLAGLEVGEPSTSNVSSPVKSSVVGSSASSTTSKPSTSAPPVTSATTTATSQQPTIINSKLPTSNEDIQAKQAAEFAVKFLNKGSLTKLASAKASPFTGTKYKLALHVKNDANGEVHAHVVSVFVPSPGSGEEMKVLDSVQTGVVGGSGNKI